MYFLSHWHSGTKINTLDHYQGITNKWEYGPILTSVVTRKILLTKYPKLEDKVIGLEINVFHTLKHP